MTFSSDGSSVVVVGAGIVLAEPHAAANTSQVHVALASRRSGAILLSMWLLRRLGRGTVAIVHVAIAPILMVATLVQGYRGRYGEDDPDDHGEVAPSE